MRIVLPYAFYILTCLGFTLILVVIFPEYFSLSRVSVLRIFTFQDSSLPIPFMCHLWFILPYFIVACSFPVQKMLADRMNRWAYMMILFGLCVLSFWLSEANAKYLDSACQAIFYNFFFMAGYLFYKRLDLKFIIAVTIISFVFASACLWIEYNETGAIVMQSHKFPPDFTFLVFGLFCLSFFSIVFHKVEIPQNQMLARWNKYGYSIYLWQNISFTIYVVIYNRLDLHILPNHPIIDFICAAIGIFIISTLTSFAIVPIESKFVGWVRRMFSV